MANVEVVGGVISDNIAASSGGGVSVGFHAPREHDGSIVVVKRRDPYMT